MAHRTRAVVNVDVLMRGDALGDQERLIDRAEWIEDSRRRRVVLATGETITFAPGEQVVAWVGEDRLSDTPGVSDLTNDELAMVTGHPTEAAAWDRGF